MPLKFASIFPFSQTNRFSRDPTISQIKWTIPPSSTRVSSRQDYKSIQTSVFDIGLIKDSELVPYCIDLRARRVIYTKIEKDDLAALFSAPFLYLAQRKFGREIISIPFAHLNDLHPHQDVTPTFIFSPGRTGSTLLSQLLSAVGVASISEPDTLTQLALLEPKEREFLGYDSFRDVVRDSVASLARYAGNAPYIKLRSHCTPSAEQFATAEPNARLVFMFRGIVEWATSRHINFHESPEFLARMMAINITTLGSVFARGIKTHVIIYENLVSQPLHELSELVPGTDANDQKLHATIASILAADSQAGVSLVRNSARNADVSSEFLNRLRKEWEKIRPAELIAAFGLGVVDSFNT